MMGLWVSLLSATGIISAVEAGLSVDASSPAARVRRNAVENIPDVDLPFGDINVVVLTDVHSWIAGHGRHDSNMDADYGDVLSFYERLQQYADDRHKDLFFVMNGDFMDGTGLSTTPPKQLTPLLEQMPWDAVNLGNHELYDNDTVDWIVDHFVPHWGGNYLSSNTLMKASGLPIGDRYTYLRSKHSNTTVLTFGFLYNFKVNSESTKVEEVEQAVQQEWFIHALSQQNFDAILVLAHMHFTDRLVTVIKDAIRDIVGFNMAIQFITGHSHIRGFSVVDQLSTSFEAGKFLDTIGFCSFPNKTSLLALSTDEKDDTEELFPHVFIDTNRVILAKLVGVDTLSTTAGTSLSDKIYQTQQEMGLLERLGCASQTFTLGSHIDEPSSLQGLYIHKIIPTVLTNHDQSKFFVQSSSALRSNLIKGDVLLDDIFSFCPFNDTIYQIASNISGQTILDVLGVDELGDTRYRTKWMVSVDSFAKEKQYDLLSVDFNAKALHTRLQSVIGLSAPLPKPLVSNDRKGALGTTDLWRIYIKKFWSCDQFSSMSRDPGDGTSSSDKSEYQFAVALFIGMAIGAVWLHHKRSRDMKLGHYDVVDDAEEEIEIPPSERNLEE